MEASSSTSSQNESVVDADQPIVHNSEDSDSCSSISSSTEKRDQKTDELGKDEMDNATSTSEQCQYIEAKATDGIQDSHVTTADQSNDSHKLPEPTDNSPTQVESTPSKSTDGGNEATSSDNVESAAYTADVTEAIPVSTAETPSQSTDTV